MKDFYITHKGTPVVGLSWDTSQPYTISLAFVRPIEDLYIEAPIEDLFKRLSQISEAFSQVLTDFSTLYPPGGKTDEIRKKLVKPLIDILGDAGLLEGWVKE
jgi:hypothetical protein